MMNNDNLYKPSGNVKDTNRTYVPDLYRQVAAEMLSEETSSIEEESIARFVRLQKRPIIGVLYSISAGIDGELFPVYVGRNTIGSDPSCDICLRETSVSSQHGILLARKQTNADGDDYIHVVLSDNNSNYGISVNGERLNLENIICSDGDVIQIGQNYVLILSLFNALDKLSVSCGFEKIVDPQKVQESVSSLPTGDIIGGFHSAVSENHEESNAHDSLEEDTSFFYKPSKQQKQDHYNNKTIIL